MFFQHQFNAMIDALMQGGTAPSPQVAKAFAKIRLAQASKALQSRNILISATGSFPAANSNSQFTVFTPPVGYDVIVFGCSMSDDLPPTRNRVSVIRGETRIRPPQPLSDNYVQSQKAFAPGTYSIYFPVPFILEAGDQIAVDFGFNGPQSQDAAVDIAEQQVIFFCLQVKDCLDSADKAVLDEIQSEIAGNAYQRKLLLPCTNFTQSAADPANQWEVIRVDTTLFTANATTRPLSQDVVVLGYSLLNCNNARIALGDSALQHSFTLGQLLKSPNLFWAQSAIEPGIAGPFYSYFRFPMPHLLRQGSQLTASVAGGLSGVPISIDDFSLSFECMTV